MKVMTITLVVLTAAATMTFIKADRSFDLRRALPFCDGRPPNLYHGAALALLLIWIWGICRLRRRDDDQ